MKTYRLEDLKPVRLKTALTFACDRCGELKKSKNVVLVGPIPAEGEGKAPVLCNGCYGALVAGRP